MATLISGATGNFTAAGTWYLCSSSSEQDSEAASTATTTSYVASSSFVTTAITINALAIKISARSASPTGTFSIELYNATLGASVANTETTVNVTDLDSNGNGWYVFPTAGDVLLLAVTSYQVRVKSSTSGQVTVYRDSTAGNWTRQLRTTTTQAPASGDKLIIAGEHTGAGTGNSFIVTMNETATTSYGPTVSGGPPQGIMVCKRSTLAYGNTASTAYYLKMKGIFAVYASGTFTIGTSGTPINASGTTAVLEFDSASNVDSGLIVFPGGTFNAYGKTLTTTQTLLTANVSAAGTTLTIASTSGWTANDVLGIASTTRTSTECESKIVSTVDSATQVTLTAGVTNAHSGTSPTQAEVINLTRTVKIRGISSSLQGYIYAQSTSTLAVQYAEIYNMGSGTSNKRGIDAATTTGSFDMQYCAIYDFRVASSNIFTASASATNNITFSNNVVYNMIATALTISSTNNVLTFANNIFMRNDAGVLITATDSGCTFTGNTIIGAGNSNGMNMTETNTLGTFTNNTFHSNGINGLNISNAHMSTITNTTSWRNTGVGINFQNTKNITVSTATLFGNTTSNVSTTSASGCVELTLISVTANGDSTFSTTNGLACNTIATFIMEGCDFSTASGIKTAHTNDINIATNPSMVQGIVRNCKLGATTDVANQTSLMTTSFVKIQKNDQTVGSHKAYFPYGTITIDTTIYDTTPSARGTPNNGSSKLEIPASRVSVASGATVTPTVKVRKSVIGDGTAYNGNQLRLIVKKNVAAGIAADAVLDTSTASADGAFESLTGTTDAVTDDAVLDFVIDGDGTTGWFNVDTSTVS